MSLALTLTTVEIPTILRPLTGERQRVEASGATVLAIIEDLERQYPGIQARLMKDGEAHRFVNIYLNDEDVRFLDRLATPVSQGDALTILPAVAGGASA